MGTTSKYSLPWPAPTAFVKDGAAAIRSLAEAVELALTPPFVAANSTGEPDWGADKTGRVPFDMTDVSRMRGVWTSQSSDRHIIPPSPGWYMVTASFRFGGKAEADTYQLAIQTKVHGADESTAINWIENKIEIPSQAAETYSQLTVSTLARVQADDGLQVRVQYAGASTAPATALGSNKLRAIKVSAL